MKNIHAAVIVRPGKVAAFINALITRLTMVEGFSCSIYTTVQSELSRAGKMYTEWTGIPALAEEAACIMASSGNSGILMNNKVECDLMINLSGIKMPEVIYSSYTVIEPSILKDYNSGYYPVIASSLSYDENSIPCFIQNHKSDASIVLWKEGWFKSSLHSYTKTVDSLLTGTIHLLYETVLQYAAGIIKHKPGIQIIIREYSPVKALQLLYKNKINHQFRNLFYTSKWNTGIADLPIDKFIGVNHKHDLKVKWLDEAERLNFKADPFGIIKRDEQHILYEYFSAADNKGYLYRISDNKEEQILNAPVHLSYPYTFQNDNEWYCIPEKNKAGCIDLYRFNPSDNRLVFVKTLVNSFAGVDNSIIRYNNKWWLFSTNGADKGSDIRLHIFHAEDFTGEWKSHSCNPVKTDIRSARCGGSLFIHHDKLYRPAQDSSKSYGAELCIMEITKLTEDEFEEHEVNRITPALTGDLYPDGIHTISSFGNKTLIDGKRNVFSMRNLFKAFKNKYA